MIGLNNIFNIRHNNINRWIGEISHTRGFCDFDMVNNCIRAMCIILRTYRLKHNLTTVSAIINRFAPSCENDTDRYIRYVAQFSGLNPDSELSSVDDYVSLILAISRVEVSFSADSFIVEMVKFYVREYLGPCLK